jgi:hypothetical protein
MAWAALPFLALPGWAGRPAWLAVNLGCLLAMLRWGWRLAGGGPLEGPAVGRREHAAALAGAACGVFYLQNCLAHQQTDLVLGALLVGGCLLLARGRALGAATCCGLAAAGICTGLLFAPYLGWRGRPWAAAWLLCVALGANLLPDLVSRSPSGHPWLAVYAGRFLRPLTAPGHYVGCWGSDPLYNLSLAGAGQRWCNTAWSWQADDCTVGPRPSRLGPLALRAAVYGFQLALVLAVLWVCGRPLRPLAGEDGPRQALECAVVLLLMLLLSPMSSKAHFGTLLVAGFCVGRAAAGSGSRLLWGLLLSAGLLGLFSNKDPLGERLYTLSLWYGLVTWQTLVLLAGCLVAIRRSGAPLPCPAAGREAEAGGRAA